MKWCLGIALGLCLATSVARAQTVSSSKSPDLQATEGMLLQEMTAHRDWQARAIQLEQQLAEANAKVKTLTDTKAPAPSAP